MNIDPRYDPPWSEVRDKTVSDLIKKHRDELETQDDPLVAAGIRGAIKALRNLEKEIHPELGDPELSNDVYNPGE
mgnify:CR=1 FL=1|tara:strand:- start:40196 stop:40420 length:225 start_codon:yes stop_codon:yes gene_type:complete